LTIDDQKDELAALERALDAFDAAATEEYFGARLMRGGLERRHAQLLARRLEDAPRSATNLDLSLRPASNGEAGAELSLVSSVLNALQETVQAIAQSVKDRPTSRGVVPVEIQDAVRLRVAFALPGSLDLRIVPAEPTRQQPLFEDGEETLLELSMDSLISLLNVGAKGDTEQLLQQVAAVGPRATTHLDTLTTALAKADAGLSLRWRSRGRATEARMASAQASQVNGLLKRVTVEARDRVVSGRLVGGSLVRRVFELELEDGSVLSGKVEERALGALAELFGRDCVAEVQISETSLPSGETRETFLLKALTA